MSNPVLCCLSFLILMRVLSPPNSVHHKMIKEISKLFVLLQLFSRYNISLSDLFVIVFGKKNFLMEFCYISSVLILPRKQYTVFFKFHFQTTQWVCQIMRQRSNVETVNGSAITMAYLHHAHDAKK